MSGIHEIHKIEYQTDNPDDPLYISIWSNRNRGTLKDEIYFDVDQDTIQDRIDNYKMVAERLHFEGVYIDLYKYITFFTTLHIEHYDELVGLKSQVRSPNTLEKLREMIESYEWHPCDGPCNHPTHPEPLARPHTKEEFEALKQLIQLLDEQDAEPHLLV